MTVPEPEGPVPERVLIDAVSRVLFERWDPIGAKAMDPAWPADEYEGYAADLLRLVLNRASDDVLAEHLAQLENHWMGLVPSPLARRLEIAAALRSAVRDAAQ